MREHKIIHKEFTFHKYKDGPWDCSIIVNHKDYKGIGHTPSEALRELTIQLLNNHEFNDHINFNTKLYE